MVQDDHGDPELGRLWAEAREKRPQLVQRAMSEALTEAARVLGMSARQQASVRTTITTFLEQELTAEHEAACEEVLRWDERFDRGANSI